MFATTTGQIIASKRTQTVKTTDPTTLRRTGAVVMDSFVRGLTEKLASTVSGMTNTAAQGASLAIDTLNPITSVLSQVDIALVSAGLGARRDAKIVLENLRMKKTLHEKEASLRPLGTPKPAEQCKPRR